MSSQVKVSYSDKSLSNNNKIIKVEIFFPLIWGLLLKTGKKDEG